MDVAGHDADLAGVGRNHTGAVRTHEAGGRPFKCAFHLHHVQNRDAFGDADDHFHFGVNRLEDRICGKRGRHIDDGGVGFGGVFGLVHGVEHRQVQMRHAAFAGRDAAHHLGAIGDRLFGVERALASGEALADHFGVFVDKYGHSSCPS